ncbi:condensation domain-containing protein [Streptomyces sp. PmtG]
MAVDPHPEAPVEHVAPLTGVQQGMWFLTQLEGQPAYMFQAWLTLRGRLDRDALRRTLDELIRRHSVLRTTFATDQGRAYQRVHAPVPADIEVRSVTALSEAERQDAYDLAVREVVTRPFDPTRLPLIRWTLFEVAEDEHRLLQSEHHLIHDGGSFVIFADEFVRLYHAYSHGQPDPLPPPSAQYWSYAEEDRLELAERLPEGLEYWRKQLRDLPGTLTLPLDRPRPAVQRFHGSTHDFVMDPELARRVREEAKDRQVTLFGYMLAALAVLLRRYSDETDLLIGSGVANRSHPSAQRMIGMLVSTVTLRIPLADDPTVDTLLQRTHTVLCDALDNQDIPFSDVVRDLRIGRTLSINPLTPVLFSFHDLPMTRLDDDALTIDVHEGLNAGAAKVDLDIVVIPSTRRRILGPPTDEPDSIRLIWDFSTELFDRSTIERMATHYCDILAQMCALGPEAPVSGIALRDATVDQALARFSGSTVTRPEGRTMVDLFEAQAARTPDAIALESGARRVTYAELNAWANQLARELRARGVGAEHSVGVCLRRSPELVLALLGVLKAGAAYVPLDPSLPPQRLAWLATDAAVSAVVGRAPGEAPLPVPDTAVWVSLDDEAWTRHSADDLDVPRHDGALCHILYTSGSTGTPRGVGIAHRSLVNFVEATADDFRVTPADRVLQLASFAFDTHAEEIFVTLARGATLVLGVEPAEPRTFLRQVDEAAVTVMGLPTAFWSEVVRHLDAAGQPLPQSVRLVPVGGEAVSAVAAAAWHRVTGGEVRLRNGYGPTETTGVATATDLTADDLVSGRRPPDRTAPAERTGVRGRRGPARAAGGRPRRAADRRRGRRPGLRGPPGLDGRTLRTRPLLAAPGGAGLPHGRPRPLAARRTPRVPRTGRRPDQDPRLPHRADRGGEGAARDRRGQGRGGRGPRRRPRPAPPGGVPPGLGRAGAHRRRDPGRPPRRPAQLHGPRGVRTAGPHPEDRAGQDGPAGPARASRRPADGRARRTGVRSRGDPRRHLAARPRRGDRRLHRQLLRPGGRFAALHADDRRGRRPGHRPDPDRRLRAPDHQRPRDGGDFGRRAPAVAGECHTGLIRAVTELARRDSRALLLTQFLLPSTRALDSTNATSEEFRPWSLSTVKQGTGHVEFTLLFAGFSRTDAPRSARRPAVVPGTGE